MRTLDTMTSPWFFYVSTPQTRIRLVHRMMPETRFTSISPLSQRCPIITVDLSSPPSMFDVHVSWSNRISCLQVEALHSTENVFFWREFVLADH